MYAFTKLHTLYLLLDISEIIPPHFLSFFTCDILVSNDSLITHQIKHSLCSPRWWASISMSSRKLAYVGSWNKNLLIFRVRIEHS